MLWRVLSSLLLTLPACVAVAVPPTVTLTDEAVVLTHGDQSLSADLNNGTLTLKTPYRDYTLTGSFMESSGWAAPSQALERPVVREQADSIHVRITYPLVGERQVVLDLEVSGDLPAFFVTSRLEPERLGRLSACRRSTRAVSSTLPSCGLTW